jgi:hypothetical protein
LNRALPLLAVLLLSACAEPEARRLEPLPRLPDVPDAFRAELLGGRSPDCRLRGQAVYLGGGRFLTAAHLVDDMVPRLRNCAGIPLEPLVVFHGYTMPVRLLRLGAGELEPQIGPIYRGGEDLALLEASRVPPGPGARPCPGGPVPGQAVIVLSGNRHETRAGPMVPEVRDSDGAYADLPIHLAQGESGAGVFDARSFCLLGVVSHRPDATPDHSRIVPAATIRTFLGAVEGAGPAAGEGSRPVGQGAGDTAAGLRGPGT